MRLAGRRLRHVREVHRARPGDRLRVGRVNGLLGTGTVLRLDASALELEVCLDREPPAPLPVTLVLALPRPRVLRRLLVSIAALGLERVVLLGAWRVEKSYWQTSSLEPARRDGLLRQGLELAGATRLPVVEERRLFKPFVEDELPQRLVGARGLTAHPGADAPCPRGVGGRLVLAVGPEGGFLPYELERLADAGLAPVRLGEPWEARVLDVATAVPALLARLL